MAKIHYWQYVVDKEGKPINGVKVDFFLTEDTDSTQYASIYATSSTNHTTNTKDLDLKTNQDGYFEFWVGDEWEPGGGYASTQKFKLTWYKSGITRGTIEKIDLYPPLYQVNETLGGQSPIEEAQRRNKLISNSLAYRWEEHLNFTLPTSSANPPHNLWPVVICSLDNEFNKVVSDFLLNKVYTTAVSASSVTLGASAASVSYHPGVSFVADVAKNINHNLNNQYPIVQVVDNSDELVIPDKIESIDANNVGITMTESITGNVVTIIG
jgi:hypothetical protein